MAQRVLLTGATGFIGQRLYPTLCERGWRVTSASRDIEARARREPERRWVKLDIEQPESVQAALVGMDAVVYLIHAMGQSGDFEAKEQAAAESMRSAAERAGVRRIVYLGGVAPAGAPSKHLRSRLATGDVLRSGSVPTVELRAGMIIGAGGLSWRMVRDLSARLPFMILPSWLQNHSQPVAVADVVAAIADALERPPEVSGVFDLPGPELMTGEQILQRIAALLGTRPYTLRVPVLTPKLSSYWLKLVTRADFGVAQELVEGLTSDLVAQNRSYWSLMPGYVPTPFERAARTALDEGDVELSRGTRLLEWSLRGLSRRA
jgi:uncharacterized protein YbjT (DUF2867 family)